MTTAYTPLLGLALPVTGELSGQWGVTVNDSITSLLDSAISGTTTLSSDVDVTLTTTQGAANTSREAIILWTAGGTATRTITVPAQSKIYTVINKTSSTQSIKIVGAGPTTGVTIIAGEATQIAWNGVDFVKVGEYGGDVSFRNVTVTGTTTLSGLTASTALALDASKNVVSVTNTGTGNNVLATSPTLVTPILGTPTSVTLTNATGLPLSTGVTGTLATTNGGTGLTSFTANGVVYASSTSALATGSALTFDGTNLGVGTVTTSPYRLNILRSDGKTAFMTDGSTADFAITCISGVSMVASASTSVLAFGVAGSEQMRLTSTGLGIGTSSPAYKLDIGGTNPRIRINETTGYVLTSYLNTGGTFDVGRDNSAGLISGAAYAGFLNVGGAYPLIFSTNSVERMRLDSAGNLGLGVTPSAWGSVIDRAFEISNGTVVSLSAQSNAFQAYLTSNAFYNGANWVYKSTGASAQYFFGAVGHIWRTAPSGTAGNAITFTQAMTLDASGNLGVGTSSPQSDTNYGGFTLNGTNGSIITLRAGNVNSGRIYTTSTDNINIDANGTASGTIILRTGTGSTERARIDSSGNLLVGATSQIQSSKVLVSYNGLTFNGVVTDDTSTSGTTYSNVFIKNGSVVGSISQTTSSTSYLISSDYRLKNSVAPMTGALAKVAQLKPVTYKWNVDGSDGEGFIAHELSEVCPYAVTGEKDAVDEEGNPKYQGIDTSFLVATLTAAIQEQQAIIESLKARLDAANL